MIDERDIVRRAVEQLTPPGPPFERLLRRRDRKRRNQRITAGVVGIAVFVAAVWIVTSGGPFDRAQTPAATGPTVPPASTRVGFIGLPPEGATPSSPERGELVLSLWGSAGSGRTKVWVYADGRLIWLREANLSFGANELSTGFLEQHLTPEGVELMRSEIKSTRRFGPDFDVADRGIIDAEPSSALGRLVARLTDPASWLPDSAWKDREIRAYVPSRYSVCYGGSSVPIERSRLLTLLPAEAEDLLRPRDSGTDPGGGYCSDLTTEEARALAGALDDAGIARDQHDSNWRQAYRVGIAGLPVASTNYVYISFEPYLPHGKVTCSVCG